MNSISEKVELLGKGLYQDIPDVLTIKGIPTVSELEYVGAEDFDQTMLEKTLPSAVEEKIDFKQLLEIDYHWLCRCLRILNYGPYYTTNVIFCDKCGETSEGEYQVNLNTVSCKALPEGFKNEIVVPKESFINYDHDVTIHMITIQDRINAYNDTSFRLSDGRQNREMARVCYMITGMGKKQNMNPVEVRIEIQKNFSSADYMILREEISNLTDYGLRAGGTTQCPHCGNTNANFIALADDRFFRPTLGDLRRWRDDNR